MNETIPPVETDKEYQEAQKRVRKIKKFYKDLISWAGTSVVLVAIDLFLSGGITWSKYPFFFWGIAIALQFFQVLPLLRLDKDWEERMTRKFTGKPPVQINLPDPVVPKTEDYSGELMTDEPLREKEPAVLSDYRKLKKPWKDEDLV